MDPQHSINLAARRSGLTPHVIRIWERRYGAVAPSRTRTNRRLYSELEIERLALLRRATETGHRISNVARLTVTQLQTLLAEGPPPPGAGPGTAPGKRPRDLSIQEHCFAAIRRMDRQGLEEWLRRGLVQMGHQGLLMGVIAPLTQALGDQWQQGLLSGAHEHFASATIRGFLSGWSTPFALGDGAPCLVVATPAGQLHELGAVMVAALAGNLGWRVIYLGASLPAAEIAGAAIQNQARAVALSLVYPPDDGALPRELANLRRLLPAEVRILAGGRAVQAYEEALDRAGAQRLGSLDRLSQALDELRALPPARRC
jgi:DNA-binding transcriptional MerR regulator/methylmalonyl-CoA mutase cobalamin-binding subunit